MKGTLSVPEISKDGSGKFHRTIIMQIHGRLTNEQRDLIGENDNNAPPMLKIYWDKGRVYVLTKKLKNINVSPEEMLETDAWEDNDGFYFPNSVDHDQFTVEIIASEGKLEVILNDDQSKVFESINMEKWGIFENYFKAGNYLQSKDSDSFARVKYFALEVNH